jgi:hypothetical protein
MTQSEHVHCRDLDEYTDDYIIVKYYVIIEPGEIEIIGDPISEQRSTFEEF